jgi:2-dehydro-3-deoxy-D-arabinonate dehydratase
MYLSRFVEPRSGAPRVGLESDDGTLRRLSIDDLPQLLALTRGEIDEVVAKAGDVVADPVVWLPPVAGRTEVWAAGVTYLGSREARVEESQVKDVYTKVYDADRPELFFKSPAWRVVTDGEPIGIRADSELNVPEPEVAVVGNAFGEIVGYTICNDVSSRTIEGENPLYLPQAKVYAGACSLHRRIRLSDAVPDPGALAVTGSIVRNGEVVWEAETSTAHMRRGFDDLMDWAFRGDHHPAGLVLSTGTGIVPEMAVSLQAGDIVNIGVETIGVLTNIVAVGKDAFPPDLFERTSRQTGRADL